MLRFGAEDFFAAFFAAFLGSAFFDGPFFAAAFFAGAFLDAAFLRAAGAFPGLRAATALFLFTALEAGFLFALRLFALAMIFSCPIHLLWCIVASRGA